MADFNLYEYSKENKNTKLKVFIEYLFEKCGSENNEFDNSYFTILTVDDLVESLNYYITNSKITAQNTANTFIFKLNEFFNYLSEVYNIENEVFTTMELYEEFTLKYKEIILGLRKTESKDVATDDEYETLNNGLSEYLKTFDIDEIYDEINDFYQNDRLGIRKNISKYHSYLSVIPVKLILKFALKDLTIITLELSDLDLDNKILTVNKLHLPLDDELANLFDTYLKIRKHILTLYSSNETKLFIRHDGKPYIKASKERNNSPEYGNFLKIMLDIVNNQSGEKFATRRILELLEKGMDVFTVLKLSEKSTKKFYDLLDETYSLDDINNRINHFFEGDTNIDKKYSVKKSGIPDLKCPFCGSTFEAASDEWILVQFSENGKKYIACRKCKGENGKHIL